MKARLSIVQSHPSHSALSARLWEIDWTRFFPWTPEGSELLFDYADTETITAFFDANRDQIYEQDPATASRFASPDTHPARSRFLKEASDFFALMDGGRVVGTIIANPQDWSTYYLRNGSFLPAYQDRGMVQVLFKYLFEILAAHGVERAEIETSPANLRMLHVLAKLGFNPMGMLLSERWGAITRHVKFLSERHEYIFLDQFCSGVTPQRKRRAGP